MSQPIAALSLSDLPEGEARVIRVGEIDILLCHDDGKIFAVENRCSHLDEPLTCGKVKWGWIACPAHGARFDLATGEAMNLPATRPIKTYPVQLVNGTIEVTV
jgi:3-phenylpropionate/trans-cinnamate dioxygenase ferredoxin component